MEFNLNKMCDWERKKAIFLLSEAEKIGYDINEYGFLDVNETSGYVYIWSEMEQYSLYMPISCELVKSDIVALWTNCVTGEEIEFNLEKNTTKEELDLWAENLNKEVEE